MTRPYLGIDIGNKGALALMNEEGGIDEIHPMPTTILAHRETSDTALLYALLMTMPQNLTIIIEECSTHLQSQRTAASMWFGYRGIIEAIERSQHRYTIISAKKWQSEYGYRKGDKKPQSIAHVKALFPTLSLKRTQRSRKDDDNFAEAVLLAEYGRRHNL